MIDKNDVLHIAALARLKLTDVEVDGMTRQLDSILDYIDQLNSADTTGIEPAMYVTPVHDPLRDDTRKVSLSHDTILQNGPSTKKGHFAVPKVIG